MRKILCLCFLAATFTAASASAQSLFIKKGEPNTVEAQLGGGMMKDGVGGQVLAGWSYRGVFDLGAEFVFTNYNAGLNNNLKGIKLMPYVRLPLLRQGTDLPFSVAAFLGVNKHMMLGNGSYPGPDGWGVLAGGSGYIRLELSDSFHLVPEVFLGFDFNATRHYTKAKDQNSSYATTYGNDLFYDARALVKANMVYRSGDSTYLLIPYAGYQGALAAGGNFGMLF